MEIAIRNKTGIFHLSGPTLYSIYDLVLEIAKYLKVSNENVKAIICLGIDNRKIIDAFGNIVDVMVEVTAMAEAVAVAQRLAESGDTVLLSPACASFDLFESFEDRGRQFKNAVQNL